MNYTITLTPHDVLWTLRALETARKAIIVTDDPTRALAQTYDALITKYGEQHAVHETVRENTDAIVNWANQHGFEVIDNGGGERALGRLLPDNRYLILTEVEGSDLPPAEGPVGYSVYNSIEAWTAGDAPQSSGQLFNYYHALQLIDQGVFTRQQAD